MPSRNIIHQFVKDGYYHIYNRGVNKQNIFIDEEDYVAFLNLFKRHLSREQLKDRFGREFADLHEVVELLAFCLMPNHFHLLIYNLEERGIADLMQRTMTAYSMYFNKRHQRIGSLFQGTYKASLIQNDSYLYHISRYIHLNPQDIDQDYTQYSFSSYPYYVGKKVAKWLKPERILRLHEDNRISYASFVADYEAMRKELQSLKLHMADT